MTPSRIWEVLDCAPVVGTVFGISGPLYDQIMGNYLRISYRDNECLGMQLYILYLLKRKMNYFIFDKAERT